MRSDEMMNNDETEQELELERECVLDNDQYIGCDWDDDWDDYDTGTVVLVDSDMMVGDDDMMVEQKNDIVIGNWWTNDMDMLMGHECDDDWLDSMMNCCRFDVEVEVVDEIERWSEVDLEVVVEEQEH